MEKFAALVDAAARRVSSSSGDDGRGGEDERFREIISEAGAAVAATADESEVGSLYDGGGGGESLVVAAMTGNSSVTVMKLEFLKEDLSVLLQFNSVSLRSHKNNATVPSRSLSLSCSLARLSRTNPMLERASESAHKRRKNRRRYK